MCQNAPVLAVGLHPGLGFGYPGSSFGVGNVHLGFCSGMFSQEDQAETETLGS